MQMNEKNYALTGVLMASIFFIQRTRAEPVQVDTEDAHVVISS